MGKLLDVIKVELKLFFRNKIVWIALPIILLYSTYGFFFFNIMEKDPGQALMSSSFVVQAGLFGFMVLGYYIMRAERDNQCEEVFFSLPNGETYKIIGKFIVNIFLVTSFVLVNNVVLFIFYAVENVPGKLYTDSILYFILYWELGFIIAVVIGMIIGIFIKSRKAYVTMFILWLFIGPLNYYLFRPLATLFRLDLGVPQYILNLGQNNPHSAYNVLYGFPLQSFNFTQRFLILLLVLFLFLILYYRKDKKIIVTATVVFLIIFIPIFDKYRLNFGMIKSYAANTHEEKHDMMYYMQYKDAAIPKSETEFQIKTCDIDLKIDNEVKMNTVLKVKLDNPGDKLVFTLYRDFNINSIKDEKEKAVKFNRKGDSVELILDSKLNKGDEKTFTFNYDGYSSPLFFADENAVMLPAYFPYIPSRVNAPAMAYTSTGFYRNDFSYAADYTLTYSGKHKLYTNLNKVGDNKWEGKNVRGVTLVSGNISEKICDGITFYYPTVSSNRFDNFRNDVHFYRNTVDNVNKKFGEHLVSDVKKVFFIPIPYESNMVATSLWSFDDNLLIQNDSVHNGRFSNEENGALVSTLDLGLRKDVKTNNSDKIKSDFLRICYIVYSNRDENKSTELSEEVQQNRKIAEEEKKYSGDYNGLDKRAEVYEKVITIYKDDKTKLDKLLVKLYGKLKNEDMTYEKVNEFIDKGEWMNE